MYSKRSHCIFCKSTDLSAYFDKDRIIPVGSYNVEDHDTPYQLIPYNITKCNNCLAYQNMYLGDLNEVYRINHADGYGSIRNSMNVDFTALLKDTIDINGIVEIGAGGGSLNDKIIEEIDTEYTIIDPFYFGSESNRTIIREFIENIDLSLINANTVVMSHVFEHFYEPTDVLDIISNKKIENIALIFPDLETYIKKGTFNVLSPEHTYYVNNSFIVALFQKYGFDIVKQVPFKEHSVFFIFKRSNIANPIQLYNTNADKMITAYYKTIDTLIDKIQNFILSPDNQNRQNYIWPCSMHTIYLFASGLNHMLFRNILDNSEAKINKYLYGYNLKCKSFTEVTSNANTPITVFINGGCFNKELLCKSDGNVRYIFVNEL